MRGPNTDSNCDRDSNGHTDFYANAHRNTDGHADTYRNADAVRQNVVRL